MKMTRRFLVAAAALAAFGAHAQEFPIKGKPVRVIVILMYFSASLLISLIKILSIL